MGRCKKCLWASVPTLALLLIAMTPSAHAQFEVSPGDFTTHPIPPGSDAPIAHELSIWNRDNITRLFAIYAVTPPEHMVPENYEPIPDNSWLFIVNGLVQIEENSSKSVEMWVNIPRWENLLDKRWMAWIRVERIAIEGEFAELRIDVEARLVTATELAEPLTSSELPFEAIILVAVAVAVVALLGAWAWSRRGQERSV